VNHVVVQQSNTDQLVFKTEKLVSYISQITTLKPGDLIFTGNFIQMIISLDLGTPPGVGMGRKPPLWLKPGDKVVCEIEELGSLENDIIDDNSKSKL
jgi:2-keto-4-pentenoate hydratase/2-oxohepta-3-ene-1,7-dioic acid hydratase in catechol pathway